MSTALEQLQNGVNKGGGRKMCAYCGKESDVYLSVRVLGRGREKREFFGSVTRTVCAEDALRVLTEFRELP